MITLGSDLKKRMSYRFNISKGYRRAVEWIALNDEPTLLNPDNVAELLSVLVTSVAFGPTPKRVAEDVVFLRMATRGD